MSLADLVRMVEHRSPRSTTLRLDQEAALAKDSALLSYFYLILNGWTDAQIQRQYEFEGVQIKSLLQRLVDLDLVERLPKGRRLRVGRQILWRRDGPVRRAYEQRVHLEFLRSSFVGSRESLHWQPAELTDASVEALQRKLKRLYEEFLEMAELDLLSSQPRHSTALLLAFRPWVFSLVAERKRRAASRAF